MRSRTSPDTGSSAPSTPAGTGRSSPDSALTLSRRHRFSWATLLLLSWGCGGSDGGSDAPAMTVRDSAGIRIVETSAPAWSEGDGWQVEAVPELELGGATAPPQEHLAMAGDPRSFPDGRVVVGDRRPPGRVAVFSPQGDLLHEVGRPGEGPGEIVSPGSWLPLGNDTLLVLDLGAGRLSYFGRDGDFLRLTTLDDPATLPGPELLGRIASGELTVRMGRPRVLGPGEITRDEAGFALVDPETGTHRILHEIEGSERASRTVETDGGRFMLIQPRPFGPHFSWAFDGSRFFAGTGVPWEVRVMEAEGGPMDGGGAARPSELWRLLEPLEPLSRTRLQAERDSLEAYEVGEVASFAQSALDILDEFSAPESVPAFSSLHADALGYLWVGEYRVLPEQRFPERYRVFDPEGRFMGEVTLPEPLKISEIGEDYILGSAQDPLDAWVIRRFRLVR